MPADFSCCFFDDFPMSEKNIGYPKKLNNIIAAPKITNTIPVAWFKVLGSALLAKRAAILAQIKVKIMHRAKIPQSGAPPMVKWETAPVSAVKVIINTLVPTAVYNS